MIQPCVEWNGLGAWEAKGKFCWETQTLSQYRSSWVPSPTSSVLLGQMNFPSGFSGKHLIFPTSVISWVPSFLNFKIHVLNYTNKSLSLIFLGSRKHEFVNGESMHSHGDQASRNVLRDPKIPRQKLTSILGKPCNDLQIPVSFITSPGAKLKDADTLSDRGCVFKCVVCLFILQTTDTANRSDILTLPCNVPECKRDITITSCFHKVPLLCSSSLTELIPASVGGWWPSSRVCVSAQALPSAPHVIFLNKQWKKKINRRGSV